MDNVEENTVDKCTIYPTTATTLTMHFAIYTAQCTAEYGGHGQCDAKCNADCTMYNIFFIGLYNVQYGGHGQTIWWTVSTGQCDAQCAASVQFTIQCIPLSPVNTICNICNIYTIYAIYAVYTIYNTIQCITLSQFFTVRCIYCTALSLSNLGKQNI